MAKLTIIVPCYNSESYIDLCYKSIISQTYTDYNVIFIDDCSTDKTLLKIKSYCGNNISYIENKVNSGAGFSRNYALKKVVTEYVTFIDSDDYYDADYIKDMMDTIINNKADISICDIYLKYDSLESNNVNSLV